MRIVNEDVADRFASNALRMGGNFAVYFRQSELDNTLHILKSMHPSFHERNLIPADIQHLITSLE